VNVRFWHKADVMTMLGDVRFRGYDPTAISALPTAVINAGHYAMVGGHARKAR
jgi:hypothetical protein